MRQEFIHAYTKAKGVFHPEDPENPLTRILFAPEVVYLFTGRYDDDPKGHRTTMAGFRMPGKPRESEGRPGEKTEGTYICLGTFHNRRNRVYIRAFRACTPGAGWEFFKRPRTYYVGRVQPRCQRRDPAPGSESGAGRRTGGKKP